MTKTPVRVSTVDAIPDDFPNGDTTLRELCNEYLQPAINVLFAACGHMQNKKHWISADIPLQKANELIAAQKHLVNLWNLRY